MDEISYGVTNLTRKEADADRLLALVRGHWSIENRLHFRRDDTLKEDRCRLKGQGAQAMAAINNLVLGLLRGTNFETLPDARRDYAANLPAAQPWLYGHLIDFASALMYWRFLLASQEKV